jgi:signal transduction histidine kinase/ligand-binding sensor domain-containing protein/CheY-like chemotaxis protein
MLRNLRRFARRCLVAAMVAGILGTTQAVWADDEPSLRHYLRQTWQTAEGLPQNSVRTIVQTREGYLWFGTAEGLVRFDGVRFTILDRTSTPALPINNIDSLAVGADGSLWIGLRRYGLGRLHDGQLTLWTKTQGLSANEIVSLAATPDGSIWAGTTGQGLNRIRDGKVTIYRREQGLPDNDCTALAVSSRGLLVGTGTGLALVSDGKITAIPIGGTEAQGPITTILEPKPGDLWLGTSKGVLRLRPGTQTLYTMAEGLPANDVTALTEGRDGTIWIGLRSGGLARYREGRFESFTGSDGLPDDYVRAVYEDHEHNVWVGTNAGGVSRLHDTPFRTVSKRDGLPTDVTRAVFESQDGSMWIGTPAQGLIRIQHGTVRRWTVKEGLPVDGIAMIGQARDGIMWIGTRSGLVRMNGDAQTLYTTKDGLPNDNARSWFEDRDGGLWIGTATGVCRMDGPRCVAVDGLNVYARGFHQASDGAIWIASNRGLFRYDQGQLTHWGEREGLSSEFLTSMAAETDGTLWLSTSSAGLNRFKDGRVTAYGTAQGLYEQTVFRVLTDGLGWIWMTSNHGLFRVPRAELDAVAEGRARALHPQSYTEVDGLPSPEFNGGSSPAGIVTRDGHLWLPSAKGVVVVDPARVEAVPPVPTAHIERAIMDGRPVDPNVPVTVGPSEGNFEFQYTAFQFVAPGRLRFRYKLDGFDSDWVDAGSRRTAYYTRIPPGQYVFRVQASNETAAWGAAGTTAGIELKPRFYQTRWFLASSVLASLFLVFGVVNLRVARHRAQEKRLAEMVDVRTRELQEEIAERKRAESALVEAREAAVEASRLKSEFLANMSHEIRTPMNGIIGMTELALEHQLPGEVHEYLQIVGSSAHALLHVINDILDFAKIEAGRLDMVAVDFDLRGMLNTLSTLLGPQASQKGLALRCEVAADIPPRLVGDPLRLRQVLTNLIGNALKFTDQGEVRIEVTRVDKAPGSTTARQNARQAARQAELNFAVVDTGIGIAETDRARIFDAFTQVDGSASRRFGGTGLGLAISHQLVQLMGGQLKVQSAVGVGSSFSFVVSFGVAEAPVVAPTIPAYARARRSLAVLVAEDSPVNQLLVRRLLERAGHAVTVVETGTAAIEAATRTQFDAIFMDVQMPEMNGFDATHHIRASERDGRRRVPIIALTAHAMRGDRERCLAAGMDGYVSKPIRPELLFASLAEATGSRDAA